MLSVETLNVEIIDSGLWVCFEELLLIKERKSQTLKALVEPFQEFLANLSVISSAGIPLEGVSGVVDLVIFHLFVGSPHSSFDEVHSHLLLMLVLDTEPNILESVQLVDEFEERASLKEFVADLVFDVGEHFEKLGVVDLRISHDIPE